jgi:hypothetical protein
MNLSPVRSNIMRDADFKQESPSSKRNFKELDAMETAKNAKQNNFDLRNYSVIDTNDM